MDSIKKACCFCEQQAFSFLYNGYKAVTAHKNVANHHLVLCNVEKFILMKYQATSAIPFFWFILLA